MAVAVQTNVSMLQGKQTLANVQNQLNATYKRLSTGYRINSAKDDAAGLQISDRLTAQINGLNQGNRNAGDGIALAQTAEGAMDEINTMLQQIRTLAVQAATGTNTADDRDALNKEALSIASEITRIAEQTTYGGKTVLNGGLSDDTIYGANGGTAIEGKMTLQIGANSGDQVDFNVAKLTFAQIADDAGVTAGLGANLSAADLTTTANASDALASLDEMIKHVDDQRVGLGVMQNRLEAAIRNQSNVVINTSDARARIRDTDFVDESTKLTQQSILQQSATSMLMQANTRPQLALSLLS